MRYVRFKSLIYADISPANIMFTCNNTLDNDEYLFEDLGGEPITANYCSTTVSRPAHVPKHIVKSADWALWYDSPKEDVRIIDWGGAFSTTSTPTAIGQPRNLQSPETFFVGSFDYRHDLWRAGCVVRGILLLTHLILLIIVQIYSLFYQESPFRVIGPVDEYFYICKLVEKLGPLPRTWNIKWEQMVKEASDGDRAGKLLDKYLILPC